MSLPLITSMCSFTFSLPPFSCFLGHLSPHYPYISPFGYPHGILIGYYVFRHTSLINCILLLGVTYITFSS